jgi:CHASE3 domain sensor protein
MAAITLILKDDNGNQSQRSFVLTGRLDTLDEIDEAVEQFKNQALPQIEQELLTQAHDRAALREKKGEKTVSGR